MCRRLSALIMVLLFFSKVFPLPLLSAYYFSKGINSLVSWGRLLVLISMELKLGRGGTSMGMLQQTPQRMEWEPPRAKVIFTLP